MFTHTLKGARGEPYDPRRALLLLESRDDLEVSEGWSELWDELHHQGDVGQASYAAVPALVHLYRKRKTLDWNTYALVATIEICRQSDSPPVPSWLERDYQDALTELAQLALKELPRATDSAEVRAMLAVIAIWKGANVYARALMECEADELEEHFNSK
jgi:hypothetical protein